MPALVLRSIVRQVFSASGAQHMYSPSSQTSPAAPVIASHATFGWATTCVGGCVIVVVVDEVVLVMVVNGAVELVHPAPSVSVRQTVATKESLRTWVSIASAPGRRYVSYGSAPRGFVELLNRPESIGTPHIS